MSVGQHFDPQEASRNRPDLQVGDQKFHKKLNGLQPFPAYAVFRLAWKNLFFLLDFD